MLILDIFVYIWLSLICCMCTRLCYEEHRERQKNYIMSFSCIKDKLCCLFGRNKREPLIQESELVDSIYNDNDEESPPRWVHD